MAFINLNTLLSNMNSEGGQLVLYSGGGGPSSSNGGTTNQEFESEAEGERVKYSGSSELPAASVLGMAQSVGVTISEEVAAALGGLAMKKLRAATLLAVGFADHENAHGLRTLDFAKAEQIFNSPSYGHRSHLPEPRIRPIISANVSVLDEGPEIDLMASFASPQISEFRIKPLDPEFHVHHVDSRFATTEEEDEEEEGDEEGDGECPENDKEASPNYNDVSVLTNNHHNVTNDDDTQKINGPILPSPPPPQVTQTENEDQDMSDNNNATSNSNCYDDADVSRSHNQYVQLDKEWLEYMKVFVNCFLMMKMDAEEEEENNSSGVVEKPEVITPDNDDEDEELNESQDIYDNENEFQYIIQDLVKYGSTLPVTDVICDFFCDYLNGLFTVQVSSTALHRIVLVVDAFICGAAKPPPILMQKLSSILIEILIRPPGFQIQPALVQVFMKILKNYDELLTWACTYITEVFKRASEMTAKDLGDEYKCLLHGALLLANGLDLLDIKVAHEFGWDTSIAGIKRNHYQAKEEGEGGNNMSIDNIDDAYLEEEFNKFEKSNNNGS